MIPLAEHPWLRHPDETPCHSAVPLFPIWGMGPGRSPDPGSDSVFALAGPTMRRSPLFFGSRVVMHRAPGVLSGFDERFGTSTAHQPNESIEAATVLMDHGLDMERLRRRNPRVLRYDPARILATITALKHIDVDHVAVLDRDPLLWGTDPLCWHARISVLHEMQLDVRKIITKCPTLLHLPPDTLRAKVEVLSRMGLRPSKVLRHHPNVLHFKEDRIRRTIEFLNGVGLDGVRVINAYPTIVSYSVDTKLRPIVQFVTAEIGRDVAELRRRPVTFCLSLDGRLKPRYAFAALHSKHHLGIGSLFHYPDPRFVKLIGRSLEDYRDWLSRHIQK